MLRKPILRCASAYAIIMESLPPAGSLPLSNLSRQLPDEILERVHEKHGSLKNLIRAAPHLFDLQSLGPKNILMVSRVMKVSAEVINEPLLEKKVSTRSAEKKSEIPPDIIDRLKKILEEKAAQVGVSALYGLLTSADRRTVRKCGGILTVLKEKSDIFAVSKLGMQVSLKTLQSVVMDDISELECDDENSEPMPANTKQKNTETMPIVAQKEHFDSSRMSSEMVQHHAMFLVKYLPLHWTVEPNLLDAVPSEVRACHMNAGAHRITQRLMDFLEIKASPGCKHRILRLKRGENIPDVGTIRTDAQMHVLELAHIYFSTYITQYGGLSVTLEKLRGKVTYPSHLKKAENDLGLLSHLRSLLGLDSNSTLQFPRFTNGSSAPSIKYQILKLTVPKQYIPVRAIEHLLSDNHTQSLGKTLPEWLREHKTLFEVTIPFVPRSKGTKSELCVRRRNINYCEVSEDHIVDECRSACTGEDAIKLSELVDLLPEQVIDAIPSRGYSEFLGRLLQTDFDSKVDSKGIIWIQRKK